jgi:hypothetical protein
MRVKPRDPTAVANGIAVVPVHLVVRACPGGDPALTGTARAASAVVRMAALPIGKVAQPGLRGVVAGLSAAKERTFGEVGPVNVVRRRRRYRKSKLACDRRTGG